MCQCTSYKNPLAARMRRKATLLAAGCASLSSVPILLNRLPQLHHHRLVQLTFIALQVYCLIYSMYCIARANRIERGE